MPLNNAHFRGSFSLLFIFQGGTMKKVLLIALALFCSEMSYGQNNTTHKTYAYTTSSAQGVANIQAKRGYMGHCGGNSGYEGVGFSTISADHAIRNCCYWGQKTPVEIGVSRGPNGWYACVRYR